jgi:hypothetical protein
LASSARWSYASLHELSEKRRGRLDVPGNITFAVGLGAVLAAITYGIQPYGGHTMGWTNPWVLTGLAGGTLLLVVFCVVETRVADPMFHLDLFHNRAFSLSTTASSWSSRARPSCR